MARTGKFGRLPRAAPAIGSVIAALAREMAAMDDRNIVNAWEEGGEVDGVKITDQMLLQHFTDRRDAVDPADPLWEYYDNLVTNYTFNIEDSKMTLKYARQEVGDFEMAAFYENWATTFPPESEAYRETMRTAASYRSRGQQAGAAGSARARQAAYSVELENVYDSYQADWNVAMGVVTRALQGAGVISPTEDMMDLRTAGETGTERDFAGLLSVFTTLSNSQDPYYATLRSELEAAGLGGMTYSDFIALGNRNQQGWNIAADTAMRYDDPDNARKYREYGTEFATELAFVEDADEWTLYETRRARFIEEWTLEGMSQQYYRDVANRYADDLNNMMPTAGSSALHGALTSEVNAIRNPSAGAGQSGVEVGTGGMSDLQDTLADLTVYDAQIENVRNGLQFFTPQTLQPDGTYTNQWSVIAPGQTGNKSRGTVVFVQQGISTVPVYIRYGEVRSRAGAGADPQSMETTSGLKPLPGSSDLIGVTYLDPNTGERKWGIYKDDGRLEFYDNPPFQIPGGGAWSDDMATFDTSGNAVITWTPEADSPELARGMYVPEDIIDVGMDQGGREIAGKWLEQEQQYYLGSHEGRLAALNTTDEQYALSLESRGITGTPAAQALVGFNQWRISAAAVENEALQDRRLDPKTRGKYRGLMEGTIGTGEIGDEFVVTMSAQARRAQRVEWRDRMRTAAETFLETHGGLSPQDQRLIRGMSPEEITDWLLASRRAVARPVVGQTSRGGKPVYGPAPLPAGPGMPPEVARWIPERDRTILDFLGGLIGPPRGGPEGQGYTLPPLGGAGGGGGAPGGGYGPGRPPPQIKMPEIKPPAAPKTLAPPTDPRDLGEPTLPPPKPQSPNTTPAGRPIRPNLLK